MPWNATSWNFPIGGTPSAAISTMAIAPSGGHGEVLPSIIRIRVENETTSWAISMRLPPPAFLGSRTNGIGSSSRFMAALGRISTDSPPFACLVDQPATSGKRSHCRSYRALHSMSWFPRVMPLCMRPISTRPSFFSIRIFVAPMAWWSNLAFSLTAVSKTKWTPCLR